MLHNINTNLYLLAGVQTDYKKITRAEQCAVYLTLNDDPLKMVNDAFLFR